MSTQKHLLSSKTAGTIDRTIQIFEIDAGWKAGIQQEFDPVPALSHLLTLSAEERYLGWDREDVIYVEPISLKFPQKLRFIKSRRSELPLVENEGKLSPLNLGKGGLGDVTHVVLSRGYAAADFNFYGPRALNLGYYLAKKAKNFCNNVRLNHLLRGDSKDELRELSQLVGYSFKVREQNLDYIAESDESLAAALRAELRYAGVDEVTKRYTLSLKRRSAGETISETMQSFLRTIVGKPRTYEEFDLLEVSGYGPRQKKQKVVDLLEDQFVAKRSMVRLDRKSRAVNSQSAFDAIEDALGEMLPKVQAASVLVT